MEPAPRHFPGTGETDDVPDGSVAAACKALAQSLDLSRWRRLGRESERQTRNLKKVLLGIPSAFPQPPPCAHFNLSSSPGPPQSGIRAPPRTSLASPHANGIGHSFSTSTNSNGSASTGTSTPPCEDSILETPDNVELRVWHEGWMLKQSQVILEWRPVFVMLVSLHIKGGSPSAPLPESVLPSSPHAIPLLPSPPTGRRGLPPISSSSPTFSASHRGSGGLGRFRHPPPPPVHTPGGKTGTRKRAPPPPTPPSLGLPPRRSRSATSSSFQVGGALPVVAKTEKHTEILRGEEEEEPGKDKPQQLVHSTSNSQSTSAASLPFPQVEVEGPRTRTTAGIGGERETVPTSSSASFSVSGIEMNAPAAAETERTTTAGRPPLPRHAQSSGRTQEERCLPPLSPSTTSVSKLNAKTNNTSGRPSTQKGGEKLQQKETPSSRPQLLCSPSARSTASAAVPQYGKGDRRSSFQIPPYSEREKGKGKGGQQEREQWTGGGGTSRRARRGSAPGSVAASVSSFSSMHNSAPQSQTAQMMHRQRMEKEREERERSRTEELARQIQEAETRVRRSFGGSDQNALFLIALRPAREYELEAQRGKAEGGSSEWPRALDRSSVDYSLGSSSKGGGGEGVWLPLPVPFGVCEGGNGKEKETKQQGEGEEGKQLLEGLVLGDVLPIGTQPPELFRDSVPMHSREMSGHPLVPSSLLPQRSFASWLKRFTLGGMIGMERVQGIRVRGVHPGREWNLVPLPCTTAKEVVLDLVPSCRRPAERFAALISSLTVCVRTARGEGVESVEASLSPPLRAFAFAPAILPDGRLFFALRTALLSDPHTPPEIFSSVSPAVPFMRQYMRAVAAWSILAGDRRRAQAQRERKEAAVLNKSQAPPSVASRRRALTGGGGLEASPAMRIHSVRSSASRAPFSPSEGSTIMRGGAGRAGSRQRYPAAARASRQRHPAVPPSARGDGVCDSPSVSLFDSILSGGTVSFSEGDGIASGESAEESPSNVSSAAEGGTSAASLSLTGPRRSLPLPAHRTQPALGSSHPNHPSLPPLQRSLTVESGSDKRGSRGRGGCHPSSRLPPSAGGRGRGGSRYSPVFPSTSSPCGPPVRQRQREGPPGSALGFQQESAEQEGVSGGMGVGSSVSAEPPILESFLSAALLSPRVKSGAGGGVSVVPRDSGAVGRRQAGREGK